MEAEKKDEPKKKKTEFLAAPEVFSKRGGKLNG